MKRRTKHGEATFIGEVHKGQLCFGQPLAEFEGKQVLITLIAPMCQLNCPVQAHW